MNLDEPLPALRGVDVTIVETEEGEPRFALQDRSEIAPQSLIVSAAGYFVLMHLDGRHTCADIQAEFQRHTGMALPAEQIAALIAALDDGLMLEGERFEQACAARAAEYRAAPARDNRTRYPEANELRAQIDRIVAAGSAAPVKDVRGLVAPHLDYPRGAPCYADAYATLGQAARAERFVILGTNHAGRASTVVATGKDFLTPLGNAETDREFIAKLEDRLGCSLREHEADHLAEHSIELQVHFLQVVMGDSNFTIVPVLCATPAEAGGDGVPTGTRPSVAEFADALGGALAADCRRTVVIAGADLSHVGLRFGDPEPTTPEFLAEVARSDRELLTLLEQREEDEFVRRIGASGNSTRVCSAGCLYALLRALPDRPCRILSYHQATDYENHTHVTCAAAVVS